MSGVASENGPFVNTLARADWLSVTVPFAVEEYDAERLLRTLAGSRNIDLAPFSFVEMRRCRMIATELVTVPEGWSASDRDTLGNELILGLQMMGRQPWVDYEAAAAYAMLGTQIEILKAEAPSDPVVQDLSDKFSLGRTASSSTTFKSAVSGMWERAQRPTTELGKQVQTAAVSVAVTAAWNAISSLLLLLPSLLK